MWFEFIRRRGGRIHGWGESAQEAMPGKVHLRLNTPTQKHRNPAVMWRTGITGIMDT